MRDSPRQATQRADTNDGSRNENATGDHRWVNLRIAGGNGCTTGSVSEIRPPLAPPPALPAQQPEKERGLPSSHTSTYP
jgi:hypothetical protein